MADEQVTEYGGSVPGDEPGGPTYDENSYRGIGDRDNTLTPGLSVALTPEERMARFGVSGKSTGQEFEYEGQVYRDDDTAAQYYHGRDEGKRIDVYKGGGAAGNAGSPERFTGLGAPSLSAGSLYDPSSETGISAPELTLDEEPEEQVEKVNTDSPYEAWQKKNPLLADIANKSDVIEQMHASIAPDMNPELFAKLADSKNGWQAIQDIKDKVTPIARFRKNHPEFSDISDERITSDVYSAMVNSGKIKSGEMDLDEFNHVFNPKTGIMNAAYEFFKGGYWQGGAEMRSFNKDIYGTPSNFSNWFYDTMDKVGDFFATAGPGAKDPITGKDVQVSAPHAGTKLKTLGQQADDYLQKNGATKGFDDYMQHFADWLTSLSKQEGQYSQFDLQKAAKAQGVAGYAGRFAGGTATGFLTQAPLMATIGSPMKGAALLGSLWMGASQYGAAVEAGHENAWLDGVQGTLTGGAFRYLTNSQAGRLKTAFLNFALNSGDDEIRKMVSGEKTNWGDFAMHSTVDLLLGAMMGKAAEKGPHPAADWTPPGTEDIHLENNGGLPADAHSEVLQAIKAKNDNKIHEAAGHLDTAAAMLSPKDRKDVAQRVIDQTKSEVQPGLAGQKHNENYFGVVPVKEGAVESTPESSKVDIQNEPEPRQPVQQQSVQQRSARGIREGPAGGPKEGERLQGESDLREAYDIARGDAGADPRAQQGNQGPALGGRRRGVASALVEWAKSRGKLVDLDIFHKFHSEQPKGWPKAGGDREGVFHDVYYAGNLRENYLVKIRTIGKRWGEDIERQLGDYHLMNEAFDTGFEFLGVAEDGEKLKLITHVPFFEGKKPTYSEIENYFTTRGWNKVGGTTWENKALGFRASDAHEGNLIKLPDGTIVPIDLMMERIPKRGGVKKPAPQPPSARDSSDRRHSEALRRIDAEVQAGMHDPNIGTPPETPPPTPSKGPITHALEAGVEEKYLPQMLAQFTDKELASIHQKYMREGNQSAANMVMREIDKRIPSGQGVGVGAFTAAENFGIPKDKILGGLSKSEMQAAIKQYRAQGKHAQADEMQKEYIRRFRAGEAGKLVLPADRIERFFEQLAGPLRWAQRIRREEYNPEALGEGAARAGNVVRRQNVMAQNAEDLRNWMNRHLGVDADLRGAVKHLRRRTEFNALSNTELKSILIKVEQGKKVKVSQAKRQATIDYILWLHKQGYAGMAKIEKSLGLSFTLKDNYIYHALQPKDQAKFEKYLQKWVEQRGGPLYNPDPKFTRTRELPTWKEVFDQGFEPKSYNPEDLFQMRLFAHTEAIKKIRTLRELQELGLAYLKNPKESDIIARRDEMGLPATQAGYDAAKDSFKLTREIRDSDDWEGHTDEGRSPNGEQYVIQKDAASLLKNAWDQESYFNSNRVLMGVFPVRWWFHGMRALKGIGSNILTWSFFHPKHILFTSLSNLSSDYLRSIVTGKPFDWEKSAEEALNATGRPWQLKQSGMPVLDYYQNKRPISSLSPEDLQTIEHVRYAGLNFGINSERAAQFELGRNFAEWFPQWRRSATAMDRLASNGLKVLTLRPLQEWQFGTLIPRLKFADFLRDRDALLHEHPEYLLPEHAEEFHTALGQLGKAIEGKYGEMNMDNLFWKKTTKEMFTAHLLSLGWQLSAIRVYAGGIKDLMDNTVHMKDVLRRVDDPKKRRFLTDRLSHMLTYTSTYMLTNAVISYINGYSQGKQFEDKDLFFPVIGKNPPGSADQWLRASPGEFAREMATLTMHIKSAGGGPMGAIYGGWEYASNKLQPMLSSLRQALIDQKNYFGADIGGDPADSNVVRLADKMEYILENSLVPIPFKQATASKPGQEGLNMERMWQLGPLGTAQEWTKDVFNWPTLWSMMGYPQAPAYVGRNDVENLIYSEYGRLFGGGTKTNENIEKATAYEAYREAFKSKDQGAAADAVRKINELGKKYHFNPAHTMAGIRKNAEKDISAAQYMFSRFDYDTQQRILSRASPEERREFQPFIKH
jgi:hypothetical protein